MIFNIVLNAAYFWYYCKTEPRAWRTQIFQILRLSFSVSSIQYKLYIFYVFYTVWQECHAILKISVFYKSQNLDLKVWMI